MGIATALVRSWEDGTNQPDKRQVEMLAKILSFDPAESENSESFGYNPMPGK
jgi:DNA-binding transcriptional regulator YiaG